MKFKIVLVMFFLEGYFLNASSLKGLGQVIPNYSVMDINIESNIVSISPQYGISMTDGGDNGTNLSKYILPKIEYTKMILNHENRKLSLHFGIKKTYLVLVALNEYKNSRITPLRYSLSDAKKFSRKIKNNSSSVVEYRLLDSQATKQNIISQFKKALNSASKDDTIIFYWSGHGIGKSSKKYMIPYEFSGDKSNKYEFVAITKLEKLAKKSKKSVILLFDGCFLDLSSK